MRETLVVWRRLLLVLYGAAVLQGEAAARPDLVFRVPEVLVRTAAVPRAVGTGPAAAGARPAASGARPAAPGNQSALTDADDSGDYFVEHEVTTAQARRAAQLLKLSDVSESVAGCGACSRRERDYCWGGGALADHCCCERRFLPEPLPWVPHACLLGARRCRLHAPSCAHYARLRDCCCLRDMALTWKSILAGAAALRGGGTALALAVLVALRPAL